MKRGKIVLFCLLMVVCFTAGDWLTASAEDTKSTLIGTPKCKVCHKSEKRGDQYSVWEKSAHAKAFEVLATEEALAVAAEKGLGNPQEAPECLVCHTTQAFLGDVGLDPKGKYTAEEGIGCEACHGAGSEYKSNKVMKDPDAAKAAGLIMPGKEQCLECHNEKSPTYKEFDFETRWAEIKHPKAAPEEG